jgi:small neutral amino acid transporter SnatA (MarC family)
MSRTYCTNTGSVNSLKVMGLLLAALAAEIMVDWLESTLRR